MTIEDIAPNEVIEVKDDEFVRSDLQTQLRDEILEVTFTKVNGDKRVMNCTLIEDVAPKNTTEQKEDTPQRKVNEDILSVWDVDAKGWRSFRVKNVTRVRQHVMAGYNNVS
jgi:hypothetical protein